MAWANPSGPMCTDAVVDPYSPLPARNTPSHPAPRARKRQAANGSGTRLHSYPPVKNRPAMCDDREDLLANLARFSPFYDWDYRNFRADIPLLKQLARDTGGPVLEAGCGTGRVLMQLATDARCAGIDICPEMLELARHNLATVPPAHQPLLLQADMADFRLMHPDFGLAVCASNSLMHLDGPEQQQSALSCLRRHLRADGLLVLDLFNPPVEQIVADDGALIQVDAWQGPNGVETTKWMSRTVDWVRQVQTTDILLSQLRPDGQHLETTVTFRLRFLWPHELELMLDAAGFDIVHLWGGYHREPLDEEADTVLCVARSR